MILNETRDSIMVKTFSPTASSSTSSSTSSSPSSSSPKKMESTELISSLTVKCKTGSDSCLAQLVKLSDQATKIEQFSRKLSEFDLKLNGFKPRSGHLHLTNSTTTTTTSTRLTTTSTASPSRSTTGPGSIRSSLPNFISHLTDHELETQHETDLTKKNKIYSCDSENENFGDKNISKSDGDSDQPSNIETNSKINRRRKCLRDQINRESNYGKNNGDDEPSLTSESIKRLTLLPRSWKHSASRSSTSKSLQSSPIDINIGSTHLHGLSSSSSLHSSSSPTTPSESSGFVSSSPSSSPRRMRSTSQLISSKLQSETNQCLHDSTSSSSSSVAYDCVDYVNSLEESPQPRISRFKPNRLSKDLNSTSTCNLRPAKSTRSYSRLNSLPCNKNSDSNDFNDENISKPTPRNCLRAFSIPNSLNNESTLSPSYRSSSISNSRESLDHGLNSGETSSHQRIVGSLFDSPKWSIIKEKFEKSSNNHNSNNGNNSQNKDKTEIVTYSSPQLRRKTYPTSTSNLTPSLSLSNLTLLSANNCGKARSISLTPSFSSSSSSSSSSSTATMDKKVSPLQPSNNETNKCNNRYSTSSLKSNSSTSSSASSYSSSSHSTSSTLTNGSHVDRPNSFSTDRLTSTTATSLSPISSSYSLENHGNYPIERMCNSGKMHLEQSVRMKNNSRIAKIASKFDSGANQSGSNTSLNSGTLIESKKCKSKSDLREFNKMITTSSSSSSTTSLFTVVKQSSECNFSEQLEKSKKSKFTSNNSISSPASSSSLSSLTDFKSIRNENEEEKIVSVKETILRLECIKASTVDSIHQSGAKINRSISDQQSTKPVISSRRKTLPGATFLHNGSLSTVNINENNDNENTLSLSSDSNHALPSNLLKDSGKSDKVPIPAPRKISNNQDSYMTKGVKSSSSSPKTTATINNLVSSSSLSSSTTFLSSSLSRHGHELNKESNTCKFNKNDKIEGNHETLKDSSCLSSSLSTLSSSSKLPSLTSEEIKKTPSFLWSNNNHNFSNRLTGTSCLLPSSTVNAKESFRKDNFSNESSQCVKESNIESNIAIEEPIYEPVSYSTTPVVNISSLNCSVNRSIPSNNLSAINRDNRTIIHDYDDNLSLASENSSLTYSDSGSYSSGVHEASTLSSSASSSNRSNRVTPSTHSILPPPLPPRWTEASKQGNNTTFTSTTNINNPISPSGLNLAALHTYLSNQWDNKDDCYGADHIYDSIYYNNLSDQLTLDKSEALSKLLKELENMSPTGDRNAKEDTNSTNSSGASMSRTPSTLSCSSVSRNGSNASESRDKSSDEFSSGIVTLKSCESSLSLESIRNTSCLSSQVPPKITPRTTIKSSHESNSGGYANFPSIMENKILSSGSLMDSILESSSPSLRESIQREIKRSEYHSRLHQSETLMKNNSFLHSNRLSVVSKKSSDYVEAINPADQKKPNINDLYREGLIHPESRYETHEYEGYMEFKETRGFFSSTSEQPLYQLYDEQVKHNRILWASGLADDSQEEADPLDAIYAELDGVSCACSSCELDNGTTPTASITSSIVSQTSATPHISAIDLVGKNGNRQLWCEVPQVKEAGVAAKLTPKERKHQEAMFEVITSEASYLKSLDILVNHFMKSEEFSNPEILNSHDRSDLFSNIESVFEITRRLMKDLDDRWQTNVVISDVCDILLRYATSEFEDYVKYLRFCKKQEKTLKTLQKQPKFAASLKQLETNPKCHGLALTSFLLLPMQRITRYPLLVEAILNHRAPTDTDKYELCQNTLAALYTVVNECNEEAKKTERLQELIDLDSILNFDKVKYFPLISESRYLMKKDEVVRLKQTSSSIIPARGRNPLWKKSPLYLYLFNDLLLIASKKSEIYYSVNDYCERNCLTVRSMDVPGEEITPPIGMKSSLENLIQLTFLKNHARRTCEYYITFPTETDKIRFIEAIEPPKSDKPNEKIYEEWDCPQVICERQYIAQQPDELSMEKSDVVNVFRKTNDWYEGERIRDGARGWFPASCTQEIVNKHVRSRNLKLRHRLMTLTDKHILDMQKS